MSDSIEYQDGLFVGSAANERDTVGVAEGSVTGSTGTALMTRPDESLVGTASPAPVPFHGRPVADPGSLPIRGTGAAHRRTLVAVVVAALVAALAVGAAVGAAVFGGGTGSGTPASGSSRGALAGAAARSAAAPTVAFTLQATQASDARTTTLVEGSGAVDLAKGVGRMTATVPALSGVVGSGGDSVSVVTDGHAVYVGVPALAEMTGGRAWLEATLPTDTVTGDPGLVDPCHPLRPDPAHGHARYARRTGHQPRSGRPRRHAGHRVPDHHHARRARLPSPPRQFLPALVARCGHRRDPRPAREHLGAGDRVGGNRRPPPPALCIPPPHAAPLSPDWSATPSPARSVARRPPARPRAPPSPSGSPATASQWT